MKILVWYWLLFSVVGKKIIYKYNICNGLSNQLLYHAGPLAVAIDEGYNEVHVPAHFIVNGVQTEFDDVLPSVNNSISFSLVFDENYFITTMADLGIQVKLTSLNLDETDQVKCSGLAMLEKANPMLVVKIMDAFRPSIHIAKLIGAVTAKFGDPKKAVCLHHRGKYYYRF